MIEMFPLIRLIKKLYLHNANDGDQVKTTSISKSLI